MSWEKFQFGQLCMGEEALRIPQNPQNYDNIPSYIEGEELSIKPAVNDAITWVKPDGMNLFIADRVLLNMVSWDDLNNAGFVEGKNITIDGCRYRCRLLQVGAIKYEPNEWDAILDTTSEDNKLWHWTNICFWGKDVPSKDSSNRAVRGWVSARYRHSYYATYRRVNVGFRPALEILPSDALSPDKVVELEGQQFSVSQLRGAIHKVFYPQLSPVGKNPFACISDGPTMKMYTLLCNGKPAPQNEKKPIKWTKGKLSLTDQFYGDEYLIPWVISNGVAVASRPVLQGISSDDLKDQGYL